MGFAINSTLEKTVGSNKAIAFPELGNDARSLLN